MQSLHRVKHHVVQEQDFIVLLWVLDPVWRECWRLGQIDVFWSLLPFRAIASPGNRLVGLGYCWRPRLLPATERGDVANEREERAVAHFGEVGYAFDVGLTGGEFNAGNRRQR